MNSIPAKKDSYILSASSPANAWEEAYPLGNGSLGAMIFGDTQAERIQLNHDTLWSGYPRGDKYRGTGKASLEKAKNLLKEKKYAEADSELSHNFGSYGSEAYLPMGELLIIHTDLQNKASGYRRTLDLSKALADVSYRIGERKFDRVTFTTFPDNALIYREICRNGAFSAKITLSSKLLSKTYAESEIKKINNISEGKIYLEGECPVNSEQNLERTDRRGLYSETPEERGIRFLCGAGVLTDGKMRFAGNLLEITGAGYLEIRLKTETSFNGYNKHPFLEGKEYIEKCRTELEELMKKEYPGIYSDHIKDYKKYFTRVKLNLGSSGKSRIPTEKRLELYEKGGEDRALPTLLFNFGRYLTISASRPGSQAMNLQGIWNPHFFAPWHSNYTVNINTEMNYFPTLAANLSEMYEPLVRLVSELSESGRGTAKKLYGADGWVCHHNTDIWRHTQPVAGMAVYLFWNTAGAWLCRHLYEYYEYTLDSEYLKLTAYPVIRESVRFYLSQLADSEDGYRIVFPSTSPENRFKCEDGLSAVSETTEMTMAAVRELFGNYLKICDVLKITDELTRKVKKEIPRLRPSAIGSDGRLLEWYGEPRESEIHHRHVSHLYGLHPGNQISPMKTPELAKACLKTLQARGDEGTGWSLAWKCNFYARLFDGNHAFSLIKRQLRPCMTRDIIYSQKGGSYPNLFCAHPPFQIDGNFGVTSGICEMLVQSETNTLHILPAVPDEWRNFSFEGLRAKGNRTVSAVIKDGRIVRCEIIGSLPEKVYFSGRDMTGGFDVKNNRCIYIR